MGKHHRQQPDKVMQFFSIFAQFFSFQDNFALGLISKSHISAPRQPLHLLTHPQETPNVKFHSLRLGKDTCRLAALIQHTSPPTNPFSRENLTNVRQVTGNLFSTATPLIRPHFEPKLSKNI